jgi:hypothetical protein
MQTVKPMSLLRFMSYTGDRLIETHKSSLSTGSGGPVLGRNLTTDRAGVEWWNVKFGT